MLDSDLNSYPNPLQTWTPPKLGPTKPYLLTTLIPLDLKYRTQLKPHH